jgi:deoxyribonuclease V
MEIPILHPWPTGQGEAVKIQHRLRDQITLDGEPGQVALVAGVDTAFDHVANILFAAVCLFRYPDLTECEKATASSPAAFPYVPGLHAFREGPVILKAVSRLKTKPDLIIFAGHGIAHPRHFGIASHLGLILNIPSIGCARKKLVGEYANVGLDRGESAPLFVNNREVGLVYRSRTGVKPIFISPGYRCSIKAANDYILSCIRDYRVPEPLRAAHRLANRVKRGGHKPVVPANE